MKNKVKVFFFSYFVLEWTFEVNQFLTWLLVFLVKNNSPNAIKVNCRLLRLSHLYLLKTIVHYEISTILNPLMPILRNIKLRHIKPYTRSDQKKWDCIQHFFLILTNKNAQLLQLHSHWSEKGRNTKYSLIFFGQISYYGMFAVINNFIFIYVVRLK